MQPNLVYLSEEGDLIESVELPPDLHCNSIRHLAVREGGLVAFAMQWQGDLSAPVPLGLHRGGAAPVRASADLAEQMAMGGYAGSIAFGGKGGSVAVTSLRGGAHHFALDGRFLGTARRADVCGSFRCPAGKWRRMALAPWSASRAAR